MKLRIGIPLQRIACGGVPILNMMSKRGRTDAENTPNCQRIDRELHVGGHRWQKNHHRSWGTG